MLNAKQPKIKKLAVLMILLLTIMQVGPFVVAGDDTDAPAWNADAIAALLNDTNAFIENAINNPENVKQEVYGSQEDTQTSTDSNDSSSTDSNTTEDTSANTDATTDNTTENTGETGDTTTQETGDTTTQETTDNSTDQQSQDSQNTTDQTNNDSTNSGASTTENSSTGNNNTGSNTTENATTTPETTSTQEDTAPAESSSSGSSATGGSGSGSVVGSEAYSRLEDLQNTISSLPTNRDEAEQYHADHYDQQEVSTQDANGQGDTTSTDLSDQVEVVPSTTAENNTNDTDDTIVNSEANSTDSATVENEQLLARENVTTGASVSGDNAIESQKDVLQGNITTGNAGITSDASVQGNNTSISTSGGGGSGWIQRIYSGAGAENNTNDTDDSITNAEAREVKELAVINKNVAFVSNVKSLLALSGRNRINAGGTFKDGGIFTGDSIARSSLLNIVNTNTVEGAFLPIRLSLFDDFSGNINILQLLFEAFGTALDGPNAITSTAANNNTDSDDSISMAAASTINSLDVQNSNEGYIFNDLDIDSISGQNRVNAVRKVKDIAIKTGNVAVANTLVNILNNDFIKSKVGVVVIDVFGNWTGNLVIPDAVKLAENVKVAGGSQADINVNLTDVDDSINSAIVTANSELDVVKQAYGGVSNEVNITANSGNNSTVFDKDGEEVHITTGDTTTLSNFLTLANKTFVGKTFSQGFYNIMGEWTGSLIGAQNSDVSGQNNNFIVASEAPAQYIAEEINAEASSTGTGIDDSVTTAIAESTKRLGVNVEDTGLVVNRLNILGDSGSNDVVSRKGQRVDIDTGDVKVGSNVSTFLNNLFVESNGLTLALNFMGKKWDGNIVYGELQDLDVDITMLTHQSDVAPGGAVSYEVAATNRGTQATEPDTLTANYDPAVLDLVDAAGASVSGNELSWPVASLGENESSIVMPVFAVRSLASGGHTIELAARVNQRDDNPANNIARNRLSVDVNDNGTVDVVTDEPQSNETQDQGNTDTTADNSTDNQNSNTDNQNNTDNNSNNSDSNANNESNNNSNNNQSNNNNNNNNSSNNNSGGGANNNAPAPAVIDENHLVISKRIKNNTASFTAGDSVQYEIKVYNPTDLQLYDVVLYDLLEGGGMSSDASWPIDTLQAHEEVSIEYELAIDPALPSGTYTNSAYASGFDAQNTVIRSITAQASIVVEQANSASNTTGGVGAGAAVATITGTEDDTTTLGEDTTPTTTEDEVIAQTTEEDPEFGVIESFNETDENNTNENSEVALGEPVVAGAQTYTEPVQLNDEEKHAIETSVRDQITRGSTVTRNTVAPGNIAYAAEDSESAWDPSERLVLGEQDVNDQRLAYGYYGVYPNFLHFDGMPETQYETAQPFSIMSVITNRLYWALLIIVLLAGYVSFKDKKRRERNNF